MRKCFLFLFFLFQFSNICNADLRNGLVGWWKFDETSGSAIDSSNQRITGTPSGTTIVTNCKRKGCRRFNGSSDYVSIPYTNLNFERTDAFSISAWINMNAVSPSGGSSSIIGRSSGGSKGTFFIWCNTGSVICNSNSVGFGLWGTTTVMHVYTATNSVMSKEWVHVLVTYSGSSTAAGTKIYKNGTSLALSTYLNTLSTTIKPNVDWRIGDDYTDDWASGMIDDVRIYNRVLTAQEAADLYKSGTVIKNAVIRNARINQ